MALIRVFLIFFVCLASFSTSAEAYDVGNFIDYIQFCKELLEKYNIDYPTLFQDVGQQSDAYKKWIEDCLENLPNYGLGGSENDEDFAEYIRWCLDNLNKVNDKYGGDIEKYAKSCIEAIHKLKMKVHVLFEEKAYGKGIVDYLEFCKNYLANYGGRALKKGSPAYKNFMRFAKRKLGDFKLTEKYPESWGKGGYPDNFEKLIEDCLRMLTNGGYHQAWSQYIEICKNILFKYKMENYEFLFDGKVPAIIAQWGKKFEDMFSQFSKKQTFGGKSWFNAEGTQAVVEGRTQAQQSSGSSSEESSNNEGLIIGLLVMVGLSLVANVVIVAFLWKNKKVQPDRM
jgi:hypothetical protein